MVEALSFAWRLQTLDSVSEDCNHLKYCMSGNRSIRNDNDDANVYMSVI